MILKIYQFLTVLLSPVVDIYMIIRLIKGKEDKKRINERFGYSSVKRPSGDIIWFQCASVGESNSAMPLMEKIMEKYNNNVTILITTGTKTSAEIISKKLEGKKNIIHQYTPIDKFFVINRFLKFWKPKVLITIESEIWPNMISLSHKHCEKVMIVNAKMSEKSFKRWGMFPNFEKSIYNSIDICYPQSEDDQRRLIMLGVQNTIFLGNLKFNVQKLSVNSEYLEKFKKEIGKRKVVLCASNHSNESEVILNLFNNLKNNYPDLIFILALRHSSKSDEIFNFFTSKNKVVKRKSLNENIDLNTDFYMYDEMGNMGALYEFSNIVLMCGSLVDGIGGHTPVEPAKHSCAILTGPYIRNNKSLFRELKKNNACIISSNNIVEDLHSNIVRLMDNKDEVVSMQKNALVVCEKFSHVANDVAKSIVFNLE